MGYNGESMVSCWGVRWNIDLEVLCQLIGLVCRYLSPNLLIHLFHNSEISCFTVRHWCNSQCGSKVLILSNHFDLACQVGCYWRIDLGSWGQPYFTLLSKYPIFSHLIYLPFTVQIFLYSTKHMKGNHPTGCILLAEYCQVSSALNTAKANCGN